MASAKVTLTMAPTELQVIRNALHLYAYAMGNLGQEGYKHPLDGYTFDLTVVQGDNRKAVLKANKLLGDLG